MLTRVARLVVREDEKGKGNLVIGVRFPDRNNHLKPGHVYDLIETFDGAFHLVEKGPSAIKRSCEDYPDDELYRPRTESWGKEIGNLLDVNGAGLFQTEQEYHDKVKRELDKNG